MTNSMLNPADSLKRILHFPIRNEAGTTCHYCNLEISFNEYTRRWQSNEFNGLRCKGDN